MTTRNLQTGDLVKARVKKLPWIFHYGFILVRESGEIHIIHNTPRTKNERGGNLVIDDIEDFKKTRTIEKISKTKVTNGKLKELIETKANKPFNLLTWNCEHPIYLLTDGTPRSPQLFSHIWFIVILLLAAYYLSRKPIKSAKGLASFVFGFSALMLSKPQLTKTL